ncbi:unnamed protein product [Prorocentrum cordatum]|uniref:Uncharacterized protein n=1 Tax=Prorocentrum cordatum TaxID=2364126 RepID=A0ABN9X8L9_9DINO|nr:unnamed protein product [Polarella glacialis]
MPATRSPSARTQERHGSTEPRKCAHQGLKKFKIAMRVEPLSPTLRCPAPLRNEGVEDGAEEEEEEEEEGGEGGGGGGVTHAERERAAQGGIRAAARRANPPPQEGTLSRSATYDERNRTTDQTTPTEPEYGEWGPSGWVGVIWWVVTAALTSKDSAARRETPSCTKLQVRRQERTREVPSGIVRCAPGSEPMR